MPEIQKSSVDRVVESPVEDEKKTGLAIDEVVNRTKEAGERILRLEEHKEGIEQGMGNKDDGLEIVTDKLAPVRGYKAVDLNRYTSEYNKLIKQFIKLNPVTGKKEITGLHGQASAPIVGGKGYQYILRMNSNLSQGFELLRTTTPVTESKDRLAGNPERAKEIAKEKLGKNIKEINLNDLPRSLKKEKKRFERTGKSGYVAEPPNKPKYILVQLDKVLYAYTTGQSFDFDSVDF